MKTKTKAKGVQPGLKGMVHLFERSGLRLSEEQYRLFWLYHTLIREHNQALDLTRIRNFESMVIKHYVDCALVAELVDLPSPLLDIGSGAGLPGIPIKIVSPETAVILAEGRQKRVSFLEEACRRLGLEGVEVYPHKVFGRFSMPVRGVITRAVETASKTLERVAPFLPEGGKVILMKGPLCEEEIEEAAAGLSDAYRLEKDLPYSISGTPHARRLLVYSRLPGRRIRSAPGEGMKVKEITSPNNDVFRDFLKLRGARGIKKQGMALFSGAKQVGEALTAFPERCAGLIFTDRHEVPGEIQPDLPLYRLDRELFKQVDVSDTGQPVLLVRVDPFPRWDPKAPFEGCTLCLPFQDPANVGAVIRSAAAFGVERVVALKEAAHPFLPKSARAAGSSLLKVPILEGPSLAEFDAGTAPVVTLSPEGEDVGRFRFPPSFYLLPGLEGPGLPNHLRTAAVAVPMEGGVESLNAALATGIVLYLWQESKRRSR